MMRMTLFWKLFSVGRNRTVIKERGLDQTSLRSLAAGFTLAKLTDVFLNLVNGDGWAK